MREIQLSQASIDLLVKEQETGMGFQLIEAKVSGALRYLVVFNCEAGFEFESEDALRDWLWSEKHVREPVLSVPVVDIDSPIRLLARRISIAGGGGAGALSAASGGTSGSSGSGGGAGSAPVTSPLAPPASLVATISASGTRKFYRFSPFNPDRRVTPGSGNFAPGTYATTDHDKGEVPSGLCCSRTLRASQHCVGYLCI